MMISNRSTSGGGLNKELFQIDEVLNKDNYFTKNERRFHKLVIWSTEIHYKCLLCNKIF